MSVWYDRDGDMLEVLWAFREGYFTPTDDERILKRLDDDGEVIGFLVPEMSTSSSQAPSSSSWRPRSRRRSGARSAAKTA